MLEQVRFYVACALLTLQYMHGRNVLHRDIKPDNLLLDASGYLRLADLGVSSAMDDEGGCYLTSGTRPFLAPEVMMTGHRHGAASDLYSLGITTFQLLVGRRPYSVSKHVLRWLVRMATTAPPAEAQDLWAARASLAALQEEMSPLPEMQIARSLASFASPLAADFVQSLLICNEQYRLGTAGGIAEVLDHPWITELDLDAIRQGIATAPLIPNTAASMAAAEARVSGMAAHPPAAPMLPDPAVLAADAAAHPLFLHGALPVPTPTVPAAVDVFATWDFWPSAASDRVAAMTTPLVDPQTAAKAKHAASASTAAAVGGSSVGQSNSHVREHVSPEASGSKRPHLLVSDSGDAVAHPDQATPHAAVTVSASDDSQRTRQHSAGQHDEGFMLMGGAHRTRRFVMPLSVDPASTLASPLPGRAPRGVGNPVSITPLPDTLASPSAVKMHDGTTPSRASSESSTRLVRVLPHQSAVQNSIKPTTSSHASS